MMSLSRWSLLPLLLLMLSGCGSDVEEDALFVQRSPRETGIRFANELAEAPSFNIITYLNYYNGAGVAAGDVNGDGLVDLYFAANEGPNRLYLNRGGFRFEDVTDAAGVAGAGNWTTGVTMVDVNADGHLDIYVAAVGGYLDRTGRNQLFINNGDGTFTERAAEYGLDFSGYGTHAAFFDYDRDGDLDVYLLNHSTHSEGTFGNVRLRSVTNERVGDRLLRNDRDSTGAVCFTDVTEAAGIHHGVIGYGLSVTVRDFDADGWPDIFVANDFHEDDFLYYNNGDGTFTEHIRESMGHTSYSSMGSDAADFNNDGRMDLVVVDMMPEREDILKTSTPPDDQELYDLKREFGYYHQYPWNTLQLAEGRRRFSEIAHLAGVHATDWSWGPLFADLDNDGDLDLFVTNGIYRRPNDQDYIAYVGREEVQAAIAGDEIPKEALAAIHERMPSVPIPNYAFHNDGDLTFTDRAEEWGLGTPGFSTGVVYADLDNDGDLDLVLNEINAPASIYENRADTLREHHYLTIRLEGTDGNTGGIGARVMLTQDGRRLTREAQPARGWLSSVDPRLHFGLGSAATIDSLTVVWPDGRYQVLTDVAADQMITLRQDEADGTYDYDADPPPDPLFTDVTDDLGLDVRHEENDFIDFNREPLMPHRLSTEGPALAVADVNGDGLEDFFLGGAKGQPAALMMQQPDGRFRRANQTLWARDSLHEDVDAAFFDADGDGDLDLYVVSGGNEYWGDAEALRDRLYRNDGRGGFTRAERALPDLFANGSRVRPADFDDDGDLDLFVGSRVLAQHYGLSPTSYLLENDGTGTFRDVTTERAAGLAEAGMVTDAAWTDVDGDGRLDLVAVGEWMPLRVFYQEGGRQEDERFVERTAEAGLDSTNGWWTAVTAADLDGDGDDDLIAGNLGLNTRLRTHPDAPVRLYINDFDGNGLLDPILTQSTDGAYYPVASTDQLLAQLAPLRARYPTYAAFGARRIEELVAPEPLQDATVREAYTFATSYAENRGDGTFTLRPLPVRAQVAPVYGIVVDDFDGDGLWDVLLGGNFYGAEPSFGRYDASHGLLLRGDGQGGLHAAEPRDSGLWLHGEVRRIAPLRLADGRRVLLVARNNDGLQVVHPVSPSSVLSAMSR